MKVQEFVERLSIKLHKKPIRIIEAEGPSHFTKLQELKGLFYHINFDCKIGENNQECKYYKDGGYTDTTMTCCCNDCLDRVGHLDLLTKPPEYFSRKFSCKTGFWRKGKGCILPREHRSITCLTYHCNHNWKGYNPPPGVPLWSFNDGMAGLKRCLLELEYQASIGADVITIGRNSFEIETPII